jgi:hypothetical protein
MGISNSRGTDDNDAHLYRTLVGWDRTIYLYVYTVYIWYCQQGNHQTYGVHMWFWPTLDTLCIQIHMAPAGHWSDHNTHVQHDAKLHYLQRARKLPLLGSIFCDAERFVDIRPRFLGVYMYELACLHMHTRMHTYMWTHIHVYKHTCERKHILTYMHIHTCVNSTVLYHVDAERPSETIPSSLDINNFIGTYACTHTCMFTNRWNVGVWITVKPINCVWLLLRRSKVRSSMNVYRSYIHVFWFNARLQMHYCERVLKPLTACELQYKEQQSCKWTAVIFQVE